MGFWYAVMCGDQGPDIHSFLEERPRQFEQD